MVQLYIRLNYKPHFGRGILFWAVLTAMGENFLSISETLEGGFINFLRTKNCI